MKYHIVTFGCQMNKSDSERIGAVLENNGYKNAPKIQEADLIVVNMCSVRQSAVDRVYGLIPKFEKLKEKNRKLEVVLTGCILKEDARKFARKFDLISNVKDLPSWPKFLSPKTTVISRSWPLFYEGCYFDIEPKYQSNFSAFLPIMTGCNNFCSFCVVPYTKGREASRPAKEILCEAEKLIKRGYKEIWLLGQNVNSYNSERISFPKLLSTINDIPGNFWIRFTSSHPKDFSKELIKVMAESQKVTEYLNLPVQSGDDKILRKMNRPYNLAHYKNLIKKVRERIPAICLSTDVIVGFPGETKKQFQNTVNLFKEIKYDMAYIAQYSPRSGTTAASLKDAIIQNEKQKRWKTLTEILKKTALENNKKYLGKEIEILVDEAKEGFLIGKSRTYKTVKLNPVRGQRGVVEAQREQTPLEVSGSEKKYKKNKPLTGQTSNGVKGSKAPRSKAARYLERNSSEAEYPPSLAFGELRKGYSPRLAYSAEAAASAAKAGHPHIRATGYSAKENKKMVGQFVRAKITAAMPWGLKGEVVQG